MYFTHMKNQLGYTPFETASRHPIDFHMVFCSIPSCTMTDCATKNREREREERKTHQNRPSTATNVTKKGLRHTQRVDRAMSLVICVKTKRHLRAMM